MSKTGLILLHGWGMNPRVFDPLREALTPGRSPLVPALPGYPRSLWSHEPDFSRQIDAMARDLPGGHLLGWSLGGIYALELALRYPHKFETLSLVAFSPCFVTRPGWSCAVHLSVFDGFGDQLERDWQRTLRRFLALQMQGETAARELSRELWRHIFDTGQPDVGVLRFGLDLLKTRDYRTRLGEIKIPFNFILGERDRLVPLSVKRQIADLEPGIQVESVAGAAHAPFLSHPGRVAALLPACAGCS